jgi:23S rRNA (adenine2503-C2)-methyltransferase
MPIDRAYPLEQVIDAAIDHARITGLAPMWAITPLAGINDTEDDARALAVHARRFVAATGLRPQISVIPYNQIDAPERERFQRSGDDRESAFRRVLREEGFSSRKRYSGGGDIGAACGQLADRVTEPPAKRQTRRLDHI